MQHDNVRLSLTKPKLSQQNGSVLIELALSFTILLVMLFGIIQYCIIIASLNTLQQASNEGAKFFSRHSIDANNVNETKAYMQVVVKGTFLTNSDITNGVTISAVNNGPMTSGAAVKISISYDMAKRTYFGGFVPGCKTGTNIVTQTTTTIIE
jgi:Flp pilus assembly protein TadG